MSLDVPVAADRRTPRRQKYHVQRKGSGCKCRHADEYGPRNTILHQRYDTSVESQQGELGGPQRDVDEEEGDPRYVEEMR